LEECIDGRGTFGLCESAIVAVGNAYVDVVRFGATVVDRCHVATTDATPPADY